MIQHAAWGCVTRPALDLTRSRASTMLALHAQGGFNGTNRQICASKYPTQSRFARIAFRSSHDVARISCSKTGVSDDEVKFCSCLNLAALGPNSSFQDSVLRSWRSRSPLQTGELLRQYRRSAIAQICTLPVLMIFLQTNRKATNKFVETSNRVLSQYTFDHATLY
jgi:hypothetical protein